MRSARFTIVSSALFIAVLCSVATSQRLAFSWERNEVSDRFVAALTTAEHSPINFLDTDLSQTAVKAAIGTKLYNLTAEQGILAASVAGSDLIVFAKADVLRRNSFELGDHYEAWAAVFLVEGRAGTLVAHRLESGKGKTEKEAIDKLQSLASNTMKEISAAATKLKSLAIKNNGNIRSAPTAGSKESGGFVAPVPYRRIKPEYTQTAYLYSVTATVEIEIDLDETGKITQTQIVRWAGFGLDESVERAVRAMNWRPAYFGKTPQPIRFVAQYNFRKPQ